jgi:alkylation response protein AidB-like acyl-CoA dehydrogenase
MNFDYSEEQQLLADSLRRYLQANYSFEQRKKVIDGSAEIWAKFAEMGLTGLPISPDYAGFGGGAVDLMGIMEAFGEALVVEPYLPTVLASLAVSRGGSDQQKSEILTAVAEGRMKLAFAQTEEGARYDLSAVKCTATRSGNAWLLDGTKKAVLGAPVADRIVVSARVENQIGLFLTEAKARSSYRGIDGMALGDLAFSKTRAEKLEGGLARIEEITDFATALVCAEGVGAMKHACDATLEYLKTRKQFGVPIGTFQALQHRVVDMYIAQEQARSMSCLACSKVDFSENAKDRARAVSAAKIKIADAARHVSQEAVQLHGGMGMSEELKVSHTFRRLTVIAAQFGDADHHLARFASL